MDSAIKRHGGKHYLAARIVGLMPPHLHYVEPYFGSGAVLFARDPEGTSEVANDLDERLMNFWGIIRCPEAFLAFAQAMQGVPFCEQLWREAHAKLEASACTVAYPTLCVGCAKALFICVRQSMAARGTCFSPLSKTRVRRGMNEQVSAWLSAVDGLPLAHERLRRVVMLSRPAPEVIASEDGAHTLFYLDPPYVHGTRATTGEYGPREMTDSQHFDLLEQVRGCEAKVMLSGYRCPLYDDRLKGWTRHDWPIANAAAGGKSKRVMTESLWCNF